MGKLTYAHQAATTDVHGVTGALVGTTDTQTLTNKTLTAPTITSAVVDPRTTTISADGAIPKVSGIYQVTKAGVCAMTLAAPSSQDGTRITIVSTTDNAHTITATNLVWDGTTGVNSTGTFQAFRGASVTLVAFGVLWFVESQNQVAWT